MDFVDAVKICFVKYADFRGCAARPEFWWWFLFTVVTSLALQVISNNLSAAFTVATFYRASRWARGGFMISIAAGGGSCCTFSRLWDGSCSSSCGRSRGSRMDTRKCGQDCRAS